MRAIRTIAVGCGLLFSAALTEAAPGDIFLLQIPGITGEVTRPKYSGWIAVDSFATGISSATSSGGTGSGSGVGRPHCDPLSVIKPLDTTSPELALLAVNGHVTATVTLVALSGGGGEGRAEFLRFTLHNAVITAVQFGGDSVSASHTEQLAIAAQRITITSTPQQANGAAGAPVTTEIACTGGGA